MLNVKLSYIVLACAFLLGCDPNDVPRLSPDGKYIVLLDDLGKGGEKNLIQVAILDMKSNRWTRHSLPEGWSANGVSWVDSKLLINALRPKKDEVPKGEPTHDMSCWLLNLDSGKFSETTLTPHIVLTPFVGKHKGSACLYFPDMKSKGTKILSLQDLSEVEALPLELQGAGDGWFVHSLSKEGHKGVTKESVGIDVFNQDGERVCQISAEEIAKACSRGVRFPQCVRISDDHKKLVLGFETSTTFRKYPAEYTFGVFDLSIGKLLWRGDSNGLHGLPVMIGDAVFALEAKSRNRPAVEGMLRPTDESRSQPTSEVVLARHTREGRSVVLGLPLQKGDLAARYSTSPDRGTFVLLVEGENPRILLVPAHDRLEAKDVHDLPLK